MQREAAVTGEAACDRAPDFRLERRTGKASLCPNAMIRGSESNETAVAGRSPAFVCPQAASRKAVAPAPTHSRLTRPRRYHTHNHTRGSYGARLAAAPRAQSGCSSVGLEHCLRVAGAGGSSPLTPTSFRLRRKLVEQWNSRAGEQARRRRARRPEKPTES